MKIENIQAFMEVVSTGSFQRAAEQLHITQSAMSARIKTLEDSLNRRLFRRKRSGAQLTPAGQGFYRYAVTLVRTWETARQEIALSDDYDAAVSLGVQLNHWKSIAVPWLQWMRDNAPQTATQLRSDYSDRLMAMLRDGLIDAALLYEPQQIAGVTLAQFSREKLVMVSSQPRSVEKYSVDGYLYVDWGQGFRLDHSRAFPDTSTHRMTVGLAAVGLQHIQEQGGSAYFLQEEVQSLLDSELLFLVDEAPVFYLDIYLAYFSQTEHAAALDTALRGLSAIGDDNKIRDAL